MVIVFLIIAFGILYLIHLQALLQKGYHRDLLVYTVFIAIAFGISLLFALNIKMPFIGTEITKLFKTLFRIT